MKKFVYTLTIILLLLVFGISAFFIGSYILEGKQQQEKFDALSEIKESAKENATKPTEATKETTPEGTFGERYAG